MVSESLRSRRSFAAVTDDDLRRLGELGAAHHERFRGAHPEWAEHLLAICLAQGAAEHRVYGNRGVKDFDVWLFYALPDGRRGGQFPWNRNTTHVDFGPSPHGRPEHTDEERDNPTYNVAEWEQYAGRRVDLLARAIPDHPAGPVEAVHAWLWEGANFTPGADGRAPSAWWLAQAPVIDLTDDHVGRIIWEPPER